MPFGFLKRKPETEDKPPEALPNADPRIPREVEFEGFTDEWRLRGTLELSGRLIDALNRREPMPVARVEWAPADGSGEFDVAPGIKALDPYDVILVVGTSATLGPMTDDERRAHLVHKVPYDVAIEAPPYRVIGTIGLLPGAQVEGLLDRGTQMFFAMTEPVVSLAGHPVDLGESMGAILVNRSYLRGIEQVDRGTGLPFAVRQEVTPQEGDRPL